MTQENRKPETFGVTVKGLLGSMPEHLRAMALGHVAPDAPSEDLSQETPAEAAERRARQQAGRNRAWLDRLPLRYRHARLADLRPWQDPDGASRAWLSSGHLNLALAGPADHGKTYVAYAVGAAAFEAGLYVVAWSMADLNAALRPGGEHEAQAFTQVTNADLLVVDDLGRERVTEWTQEQLQRVLDARNREERRTVWTSNLDFEALLDRYGDPVMGRLMDDAVPLWIEGQSMRPPSPWDAARDARRTG